VGESAKMEAPAKGAEAAKPDEKSVTVTESVKVTETVKVEEKVEETAAAPKIEKADTRSCTWPRSWSF